MDPNYVRHISQKYRLAVAIAVLKSKPKELSIEEYIKKLREKINENLEVITVNSNDFDFDENIFDDLNENEDLDDVKSTLDEQDTVDTQRSYILEVLDILNDDSVQHNIQNFSEGQDTLGNALNQKNTTVEGLCTPIFNQPNKTHDSYNINREQNAELVQRVSKNINKQDNSKIQKINVTNDDELNSNMNNNCKATDAIPNIENVPETISQISHNQNFEPYICENIQLYHDTEFARYEFTTDKDKHTQVTYDSNIERYTNKQNDKENEVCNNLTTSYDTTMDMDTQDFYNKHLEKNVQVKETSFIIHCPTINDTIVANVKKNISIMANKEKESETKIKYTEREKEKALQPISHMNEYIVNITINDGPTVTNTVIDTQETVIYTLYGLTQNNTHISQSQDDNFEVAQKYIAGNKFCDKNDDQESNFNSNVSMIIKNIEPYRYNNENIETCMNDIHTQSTDVTYNKDKNTTTYEIQNLSAETYIPNENTQFEFNENTTSRNNYSEIQEIDTTNTTEVINQYNILNKDMDLQKEVISFKVIEELNKVKVYLSKRSKEQKQDGYLTDSGYHSDSQSRLSGKVQSTENGLNQSAYSLYSHITQCPLVVATEEITREIAQVIGQLIDKLHEEEKYPSFIEELLEKIDSLLHDIFATNSSCENLLKKEEQFQRLCLLNESVHTLKYTIDRITKILDSVYLKLIDNNDVYEIENVQEIENVAYIFHLTEILVPKYIKSKQVNLSQTQSQDDKILKKSSITEIWRKKWNSNLKDVTQFEGRSEKKCVLNQLADVLNKMVVNCIEGYSLIAFSALQCFNLLQK